MIEVTRHVIYTASDQLSVGKREGGREGGSLR